MGRKENLVKRVLDESGLKGKAREKLAKELAQAHDQNPRVVEKRLDNMLKGMPQGAVFTDKRKWGIFGAMKDFLDGK